MKKISSVLFVTIFALSLFSCTSSYKQEAPPPSLKPLDFAYEPPTEGVAKSNEITFALINPQYVKDFRESNVDPYKTFASNMSKDFVAMLSARGYHYLGPFSKYDDMVYGEKKSADLVIEPNIELQFSGNYVMYRKTINLLSTSPSGIEYYADGDISVTGKLELVFKEPFSKQAVWVKSIQIEPITFKLKSYNSYNTENIPVNDPLVWNTIVDNLKVIYKKTLSTAWNHLEPDELLQKKDEANEIKKGSGFIKN
jgi:hypothetical protein